MDDDARYRALLAHDARFDGVFFVGVTTTGIYCRPICRARTPGRARCRFFRRAAEAEREGFRACFRCRPELAPGKASVDAISTLARAAAARIEASALNEGSVDDLAREMGVTARHVRRAVQHEIGVSPIELAMTCRLALAKQLLHDREMPLVDVAFASGFSSVRRFNAAFRERFGRAPSALGKRGHVRSTPTITASLGFRAPLAWRELLEFLGPRSTLGVEVVDLDALTYSRTVSIGDRRGWFRASRSTKRDTIDVEVSASLARSLMTVTSRARMLFDLDAEPRAIDRHLARDAKLRPLVRGAPGVRVPGAFDGFECAVRAVLGQQVSVRAATTFAGRLAHAFGEPIETPIANLDRTFPTAARIAASRAEAIGKIGLTRARSETLVALARSNVVLEAGTDVATAVAALEAVPGIGPWTAQYVAMRALRAPDAFPDTDLVLKRVRDRADAWSPWRAYAAMHFWRN